VFCVYMVASAPYGTIYIGQTDDLRRRAFEHREKVRPGFTAKYGVTRLAWVESFELRDNARRHERQMKVEAQVEDRTHRGHQSPVGGPLRRSQQPAAVLNSVWVPAFAGMSGY
jgi:putative endonuclease